MNNEKISNISQQVITILDIKLHETENDQFLLHFEGKVRGIVVYFNY
ncbi:hypothetical protein SC1083_0035 [Aggregatibacter actinomycetemcomitans serotype e str. SC1083]|uniref:Uncharacterized protein n=1 Tax=Aggregatibacter actinomycetemcomitans serotype e str. SC1083 TaxID=907488 RepID=G4A5F0_AGGAC|nr:hypothetical protein ANH9381_0891 [Aggregatibacter actinomycetemcomitans ANH9381]AHN71560.1 hypothetical protein CF65_01136 [Aggregatibacter actinomycetemcomitans HK1651]EGY35340.1 hypothetical protein SC1083_0035 [Aggregatibacter actinomycetemcomitans serotype e str. SC1083]EHK90733.1 hypothetical protein RHAA1_03001 [Aggregatibacter actinomycetemcomitans RhAA1]KYK73612.1 hypothetical protein SA3096_07205 [Aggregatibacter actinomycetemcomitans serotype e str. SA3096]KYK79305.1 hypothetical